MAQIFPLNKEPENAMRRLLAATCRLQAESMEQQRIANKFKATVAELKEKVENLGESNGQLQKNISAINLSRIRGYSLRLATTMGRCLESERATATVKAA